jgi:hypothetical protein
MFVECGPGGVQILYARVLAGRLGDRSRGMNQLPPTLSSTLDPCVYALRSICSVLAT